MNLKLNINKSINDIEISINADNTVIINVLTNDKIDKEQLWHLTDDNDDLYESITACNNIILNEDTDVEFPFE